MKILFLGDIVSESGRKTVKEVLPEIKEKYSVNLVLANAENLTHGDGFSPEHIAEMRSVGIDYFSTGDHVWGNRKGFAQLSDPTFPVIRPLNYPGDDVPGNGYAIIDAGFMNKILFINILGRVFMKRHFDCPFRAMDRILEKYKDQKFSAIIVDFHAEATSEKYAMGFYLDGRVSAVIGTHTHVPTADARILNTGTAFMSDAGMTGSYDSVIGVKKEIIINSFLTQMPVKHEQETHGKKVFNGVLMELDEETGKALNIIHLQKII